MRYEVLNESTTEQRLKENFQKCQDLDGKIAAVTTETVRTTHPYFVKNVFPACEECYNEAADYMVEILASYNSQIPTPAFSTNVSGLSESFRSASHLSRIQLPTFDGSFNQWESFRDRFMAMIRNDTNLTDVERLHYLCSCVKGDASAAINHLAITDNNFTVAWNLLLSRYENKRRLITTHLHSLFNLPSLASETSKDLRNLRDRTNSAVQALKNLGRLTEHWDDLIVFLVAQHLDKASRKAWELKLGDTVDYPNYRELDRFLDSRIRALEAIVTIPIQNKPNDNINRPNSKRFRLSLRQQPMFHARCVKRITYYINVRNLLKTRQRNDLSLLKGVSAVLIVLTPRIPSRNARACGRVRNATNDITHCCISMSSPNKTTRSCHCLRLQRRSVTKTKLHRIRSQK